MGAITDDGEIMTKDIWLKKLANKTEHQKLTMLRSRKTKRELHVYPVTVKRGDTGHVSAIANILLDDEYCLGE